MGGDCRASQSYAGRIAGSGGAQVYGGDIAALASSVETWEPWEGDSF
jgi:hypothetical protein